ncbi:unnamed protein product [Rhizophagus irregularis]|nr:unnamed protein product [Rhizophagus irregularis]CAB4419412.1 unnamed protein product [Rhizophagus irregularis]
MNNLKQNLAKLAKEFCNKEIPDFNELFHEDPTTDDLEKLICIESVVEQSWHPLWYDTELGEKFHLVRWDYRGTGRIGWSMGTPTTMTFMKNNPDIKIDGFISVGGMIYLNFTEASLNTSEELVKYSIVAIDPDYKISTIAYGLNGFSNFRTFKPASDQFRAFKLGESIIVPPEYRKFEAKQFDFRDFFSSLDIPTLNLIGEKDKLITLEHSLQFANLAKNGKKIVYKDIGHSPPWEDTKSVVRDITEFVSNI